MNKFYLFMASGPIDQVVYEAALDASGFDYEIVYESDSKGYIIANSFFHNAIDSLILPLHEDLGVVISVVVSHERHALEEKALREAVSYFPNQALFVTDVLLKEFSFGDFSSLPLLSAEFKNVPHELLLTAGTYLRVGLNETEASKKLIIHRNTFNYRLAKFIDFTGLDIRDYHNALLLELYFQLAAHG